MNINVKLKKIYSIDEFDIENIKNKMPKLYKKVDSINNEIVKKSKFTSLLHIVNNLACSEEDLIYNKYNKPLLKDDSMNFSISNCDEFSVYVEDDSEIGIDIEKVDKKNINIKNYAFNDSEILYIDKNESDNLHLLWTRKEAFVKMIGSGFKTAPKELNIAFCINGILTDEIKYNGNIYHLISKKYNDYYISICSKKKYDGINIVY